MITNLRKCAMILASSLLVVQSSVSFGAELTTVRYVWDWPTPDHEMIPVVVAQEKGFYAEEGLKTEIIFPPDTQSTARLLLVGQADIGFESTTDIIFGADQGLPIKAVGVFTQHNNWGLFGRPGEPVKLDDLKGKSIAIFTDSMTKAMMPFVYKAAGITENDVKLIIASSNDVPLLLAGKLDIATNTTNYIISDVESQIKKAPTQLVGKDLGVPDFPVWSYTASTNYLKDHGDTGKKWMRATIKATEWAADHPDEAAQIMTKAYPDSGSTEYNSLGWKALLSYLKGPDGYMMQNDQHFLSIAQALKDTDQIKAVLPASAYYTNELLK